MKLADSPLSTAAAGTRAELVEAHGRRLNGFALIVTMGDAARASSLAAEALVAAGERLTEFHDTQDAALWLRTRVAQRADEPIPDLVTPELEERIEQLELLGFERPAITALGALTGRERAIMAAALIEELAPQEIASVAHVPLGRAWELVAEISEKYARAHRMAGGAPQPGRLGGRLAIFEGDTHDGA